MRIAEAVYGNYGDYDGFVITHGMDTMGYTSAALSYMLQNIAGGELIISSKDMNTQAIVPKWMWVLGKTDDIKEVKRIMETPIADDYTIK